MATDTVKRHGGNVRNSRTTHPFRQARRETAVKRSQARSERSVEAQLELIAQRPGQSRREVLRITGGEYEVASDALAALREG